MQKLTKRENLDVRSLKYVKASLINNHLKTISLIKVN